MKMYHCSTCGKEKTRNNGKIKRLICVLCEAVRAKKWREENQEYVKAKKNAEYRQNPLKLKNKSLKTIYGINLDQYNKLLASQKELCAVCNTQESSKRNKYLSVDHCHKTGVIRGLLCSNCNRALGLLKDNKNVLMAMISYLEKVPNAAGATQAA